MEAVPRLPMISFPVRSSTDASELGEQLKKYIRIHYHEDPDSYNNEVYELESLRRGAVNASTDFIGCSTLKKYYCQLKYLSSRFPFDESAVKVSFNWFSAFDQGCSNSGDILFEMDSILYNIASLHTVLGTLDARTTADGMKISCTHFQCASWAYQVVSQSSKGDSELNPLLMNFMANFSLSQAQECILEKSMTDNRKPNIIAKVSMQVVEYLRLTLKNLESFKKSNGFAVDLVGSKLIKLWQRHCEFKISYYYAVTYFHQGLHSEEQQKMGERLAYFQGAVDKLNEASKISKSLDKAKQISETLTFANDVISGKLTAGQKENEFVYHEKVPSLATLPEVKGASLVKGIPFSFTDPEVAGPDIFSRLVPMEAHQASSMYSEEKAKLLRTISSHILEKNEELDIYLASMQLDSLTVDDNLDALPQELVECCADLNSRDAMKELTSIMGNINHVYHEIKAKIKDLLSLIQGEDEREKEFAVMMRSKKAPNQLLNEHKREGLKYKEAHEAAQVNNQALHTAITQHRDNITLLSKPLNQLVEALPSVAGVESEADRLTRLEVQRLLNKVGEMQTQRRDFEAQLRKNLQEDDITKQLVTNHENMEDFFKEQLAKHSVVVSLLEQNMAAQSNILQALSESNASYGATRRIINKVKSHRSEVIASLIGSYNTFVSITHKAQDANEFYSKLDVQVSKLHSKVKSLCKVQEEEREEKLAANVKKYGSTALGLQFGGGRSSESISSKDTTASGPKLRDFLQAGAGMKGISGGQSLLAETIPNAPSSGIDYGYSGSNISGHVGSGYVADFGASGYDSSSPRPSAVSAKVDDLSSLQKEPLYNQSSLASSYYTPSAPSEAVQRYLNTSPYYSGGFSVSQSSATPQPSVTHQPSVAGTFSTLPTSSITSNTGNAMRMAESYSNQVTNPSYSYNPSNMVQSVSASVNNTQHLPNYQNANPTQADYHSSPTHGQYSAQQYQHPSTNQFAPNTAATPSNPAFINATASAYGEHYYPNVTLSGFQSPLTKAIYYPGNFVSQAGSYGTLQHHSSAAYGTPYSEISSPASNYINQTTTTSATGSASSQVTTSPAIPYTTAQVAGYLSSMWTSTPPYYAGQSYTGNLTSTTNSLGHEGDSDSSKVSQLEKVQPTVPSTIYNYNQYYNTTAYSQDTKAIQSCVANQSSNVSGMPFYYQSQGAVYSNPSETQISGAYGSFAQMSESKTTGTMNIPQAVVAGPVQSDQSHVETGSSALYNPEQMKGYYNHPYQTPANVVLPSQQYNSQYTTGQGQYQQGYQNVSQIPSALPNQMQTSVQPSLSNQMTNKPEENKFSNLDLLAGIELNANLSLPTPKLTSSHLNSMTSSTPLMPPFSDSTVAEIASSIGALEVSENVSENTLNSTNHMNSLSNSLKESSAASILDITKLAKQTKRSTSVLDPLSNDETLNALASETERFSKFVQGLDKKSLNGPTNLEIKWKELTDVLEVRCSALKVSIGRCYPLSNRFPDNLPFDINRVKLPSARDDYINASFVQLKSVENSISMILTQAPMTNTTCDFWTMVWENQVEIIVCMNTEAEVKGHAYYPKEASETFEFGNFTVSLKQVRRATNDCWVQRTFLLNHTGQKASKVVLHMQFLTWPPSAMPESPGPLLHFVNEVHNLQKQQRNKLNHMVVHCVSGSGRSGVFAVLSSYIKFLQATGCLADIWKLLIELCEQRRSGILDRWHLMFLYSAALYYAQEVLMKRGILTDKATFEEGPREKTHVRHPSADLLSSDLIRIKAKLGLESETPNSEVNLSRSGSQSSIVSGSSGGGVHSVGVSENPTPPPPVDAPSPSPTHSAHQSDVHPPKIGSTTLPPNLAASLDPDMLVLTAPNPPKAKKITKESFFSSTSHLGHGEKTDNDPFSVLDPMWNLKKD